MNEIQRALYDAINLIVDEKIRNANVTRYMTGKLNAITGVDPNRIATVEINGDIKTFPVRAGLTLAVNNVVLLCLPFGDLSKAFVDLRRPS